MITLNDAECSGVDHYAGYPPQYVWRDWGQLLSTAEPSAKTFIFGA